jgi:hypothetical protein
MEFTIMHPGVRHRLQAPANAVVPGQTYHVVGTYDGATQRLYLNGIQVASTALNDSVDVNGNPLRIGSWDGVNEFLQGAVQDVAIYDHPLSAAQVKSHYDAGAQLRSTATGVGCTPPSMTLGGATTCTATVTDTDVSTKVTPQGAVGFVSDGAGSFSATSCSLSGTGGQASCSVTYTPSAVGVGTHNVSASFAGDSAHTGSGGSGVVAVAEPPPPPPPAAPSTGPDLGPPPGGGNQLPPSAGNAIGIGSAVFTATRDWSFPTGVQVRCLAAAGCRVSADATTTLSSGAAGKPRRVSVGSASLRLGNGRTAQVRIRLRVWSRRALARLGRMRVNVAVTVTAPGRRPASLARALTVRAPKRR